ncbi:MAG TPA: extracellular solute-binding protein [Streptosporangiaceae bacterium]|nr:extracellular solute-binding protein [Streptosporangiaceae bacterium]
MHRRLHGRAGYRKVAGVTVTAALGLAAVAACSSSSTTSASTASNTGHVTVGGFCAPPSSSPVPYKEWNEDVAAFEKANPNITIQSIYSNQCDVPATLTAQLAAGTEPDVYETYFGDLNQALDAGQAADITQYVNSTTVPVWKDIVPSAIAPVTAGKTLYGIPIFNYTQGLVINRQLFTQAGLNPDTPPTTWAQVETDATAITKLGNGIYGYGDYSADNNGGWHFTSELDANGGAMTNVTGTTASFNTTQGTQVLDALHTLRFTDKAMSATEALGWGTLQKQMAAGKLGMYIAAPDDIYQVIVPEDGGNINDYGMGPLPSVSGTPAGTLSGGDAYLFAKRDTPAQIEAGIKWLNFQDLTLGQGLYNLARNKADGLPVGFYEPQMFDGATATAYTALLDKYTTINESYYSTYVNANEKPDGQPADDQALYKSLDPVMLAVLTNPNANIPQLLAGATTAVNQILANSSGG